MRGSNLQAVYIVDECGEVAMEAWGRMQTQACDGARSLVNNLGYIAYLVTERHIHIKLRPSLTSLMSYSRLILCGGSIADTPNACLSAT